MIKKLFNKFIVHSFVLARNWFKRIWLLVLAALKKGGSQVKQKPLLLLVAVVVAVNMYIWMGLRAGILWLVWVAFALYEWDNRIIGVAAILCLASCPFLLQFNQKDWAELMAVYAFFFLSMTVVLQIIEFKRHPERFKDEE